MTTNDQVRVGQMDQCCPKSNTQSKPKTQLSLRKQKTKIEAQALRAFLSACIDGNMSGHNMGIAMLDVLHGTQLMAWYLREHSTE